MRYNKFVKRIATILLLLGIIASLTGSLFLWLKLKDASEQSQALAQERTEFEEKTASKEAEISALEEEKKQRKEESDALKETYKLWVHEIEKIQDYMS
ncbi:MAG: hypothetical protein IIZ47_01220 [Erysipelotrichaceae bacterium]|nr:hypothetical protein [Erysipelotrichaceae bacterium]